MLPKFRLGRTSRLTLIIGIVAIFVGALSMAYLQLGKEQTQLNQQLSAVQLLVSKLATGSSTQEFLEIKKELEDAWALYQQETTSIKAKLHQELETDEIAGILLEVAQASEVQITEVKVSELSENKLGGEDFAVLLLTVTVTGDVSSILNFSSELSQRLPTSLYELVEMNITDKVATYTIRIHNYSG